MREYDRIMSTVTSKSKKDKYGYYWYTTKSKIGEMMFQSIDDMEVGSKHLVAYDLTIQYADFDDDKEYIVD